MNRYAKIFIFTLLFFCFGQKSQASTDRTFYLITCEPGDEIYTLFGHSALRYEDKQNNLDIVFNYGLFNFNTPNFLWKFVSGETDYLLGYSRFERFVDAYRRDKRAVYQDTLHLTSQEKDILFENLRVNLKKENRVYRYNYLRNNCSTKLEEQTSTALSNSIEWKHNGESPFTFRELLDQYMTYYSWDALGIYLALGAKCDQTATWKETQFLPEYLQSAFTHAHGPNGQKLTQGETYTALKKDINQTSNKTNPTYIFVILLVVAMILYAVRDRFYPMVSIFLKAFWLVNAIAGMILCFLCFVSVHPLTGYNLNILVLTPVTLVLVFLKSRGSKYVCFKDGILKLYILGLIIFGATTLIFGVQKVHIIVYILASTYAVLAYTEYRLNTASCRITK
ncbi:DUF4105 domain-containing protein [Halosquirtibacter xylanolyticus]|uniref:lipoprotein N-acyltransferase Lnb domain-containing protein n=1 Tax=Halosquirtibacter xylanolyticus TaxID=3374599 RepID=UPI00374A19B5|nr:DUF4105 domain-containing protein [Prolixibacteraceae bacterium]